MAINLNFSNQGSAPGLNNWLTQTKNGSPQTSGTRPGLNNWLSQTTPNIPKSTSNINAQGGTGSASYGPAMTPKSGMIPSPAGQGAGAQSSSASDNASNAVTGMLGSSSSGNTTPAATIGQQGSPPNSDVTAAGAPGSATFPGMVNKLANQQPISSYQSLQDRISANLEEQKNLANENKQKQMSALGDSGWMTQATGRQGMLQGQYNTAQEALAQQGAGLSTQLGAANTQQGLQQTGLTSAATLAQPQGNTAYFGNPLTGGTVNPSGAGTSGGQYNLPTSTGNPMMDKTIYQALQMAAQPGVDPSKGLGYDSVVALNNPGALQAYLDGVQALKGGKYNPTMTSATSEASAGSAGQLTTDIINLNQNINQVDAAGQLVTKFMSQNPQINQTIYGMVNSEAQKYLTNIGATAALVQYNDLMGTVKKYATEVISSGYSGTPTGAQALQQLADPSNLRLQDIQNYLDTVKADGNTQLGVKQKALTQLGGSTSVPPASTQNNIPTSQSSTAITNPYVQTGVAAAAQNLNQIWNSISNIGGDLLGAAFGRATK